MRSARGAVFVISCAALAGCTSAPPPINCPPLVNYSALDQQVLLNELSQDPRETQVWIEDYEALRQACKGPQ